MKTFYCIFLQIIIKMLILFEERGCGYSAFCITRKNFAKRMIAAFGYNIAVAFMRYIEKLGKDGGRTTLQPNIALS